jgi:uncharacterized protein YqgC (DUF456 family)
MTEFITTAFPYIFLALMAISALFSIVPIFPGGVVIWALAMLYGLLAPEHFSGGIWFYVVITLLMIASTLADNLFMGGKALQAGASWRGIILALLAGVVVSLVITPLGGLAAAALVLYLHEKYRLDDKEKALEITKGLVVGCGWAAVVRFGIAVVEVLLWALWAW